MAASCVLRCGGCAGPMGLEGTASAGTTAAADIVANCWSDTELVVELAAVELAATGAGAGVELAVTATGIV